MAQDGATLPQGVHPDPLQRDDAEAKMKAAPIKTVAELPEDHPMRRRQEMLDHIGGHSEAEGTTALTPPASEDDDPDEVAAEAARSALAATAAAAEAAEKAKAVEAPKVSEVATEIASQAGDDKDVIDLSALEGKSVRIKVDGVETLVPATKVLGQFQKGAAADVRLANATKAERDARAAADKIIADARATASTTPVTTKVTAADTEAAVAKFKEANEAIFVGDAEKAAKLMAEGTALIQTPAPATGQPFDQGAMVQEVARGVKAQLSQERALETLFTDYPEFKTKRAFQIVVDEAIAAKVQNGVRIETAIKEAGDEVAEEYKLGKFGTAAPVPAGRQIKVPSGTPTTVDAKRAAKDGLDNIQAGNARVASPDDVVETPQSIIEQMMSKRAGARVI